MRQIIGRSNKGQGAVRILAVWVTLLVLFASLVGMAVTPQPAEATDFSGATETKLAASDGAAYDYFGRSVAISENTMVVGAVDADVGSNQDQGAAYVFVRSGTDWLEQAKLTASDGAAQDEFGVSVAIDGDTVVVGVHDAYIGYSGQGTAYVFVRSGTTWVEQQKLTASDGSPFNRFGHSLAISGDSLVVGAFLSNVGSNTDQGAAYVFVRSGTTWVEQQKLTASDGAAYDVFGHNVAIDGDTVVVGAIKGDGANTDQGSAYVFVRSGTTWVEQQKLTASDGATNDWFGNGVTISEDSLVAGAPTADVGDNTDQGAAYFFVRSGTTWVEQQKLTSTDGASGDRFGESVDISGDSLVASAWLDDVGAISDQGSAYVFVRSGTDWLEQTKLSASDGAYAEMFGYSALAIYGNLVVVGARQDSVGINQYQGSAYVYESVEEVEGGTLVSATVTLQSISVTIAEGYPTAVGYGVMAPGTEAIPATYTPGTYSYLRVENNGSVAEDLLIKGVDATCGAGTWTLAATPGADQYSHLYGIGQSPVSYSLLSTAASTLGSNVAVGGTVDFNLKILTPTSSTVYGQYSTTVTILAVAH